MARRRIPRELCRRTWSEGTAWELLVVADLLPYRFASSFADLGLSTRQRRELRREEALLKGTTIAYILPQPARPRRPSQPWLYVRTERGGHYRVGEAGEIERFGQRTQHQGSASITEYRWYPCSLRGVRWLQIVATGRMVRKLQADQSSDVQPSIQIQAFADRDVAPGSPSATVQLPLLLLPHDGQGVGG